MTEVGNITLILSCMKAGKTTELFRLIRRYKIAKKKVIIITPLKSVETHDGEEIPSIPLSEFKSVDIIQYDVFGFDEGQFVDDIDILADTLANLGKIVIISALNSDFRREPFKNISKLIPKVEKIICLSAICEECGNEAHFSKKIGDNKDIVDIDSKYQSVCRLCYNKN